MMVCPLCINTDHPLAKIFDLHSGEQSIIVPDVQHRTSYVIAREFAFLASCITYVFMLSGDMFSRRRLREHQSTIHDRLNATLELLYQVSILYAVSVMPNELYTSLLACYSFITSSIQPVA
jgi:hypothetical protein